MALTAQTLCYVLRPDADGRLEVLLGRKLRGFGAGKVMGLGGHVDPGETDVEAAVREVWEEAGVRIGMADMSRRASIVFRFPAKPQWDAVVSVFVGERWTGEPSRTDEIDPEWFPVDDLPLNEMWDDERYWLPRVLDGERLDATVTYDESCARVAKAVVKEARFE
jgi:8-oxo-dGTP diphosphatase